MALQSIPFPAPGLFKQQEVIFLVILEAFSGLAKPDCVASRGLQFGTRQMGGSSPGPTGHWIATHSLRNPGKVNKVLDLPLKSGLKLLIIPKDHNDDFSHSSSVET